MVAVETAKLVVAMMVVITGIAATVTVELLSKPCLEDAAAPRPLLPTRSGAAGVFSPWFYPSKDTSLISSVPSEGSSSLSALVGSRSEDHHSKVAWTRGEDFLGTSHGAKIRLSGGWSKESSPEEVHSSVTAYASSK